MSAAQDAEADRRDRRHVVFALLGLAVCAALLAAVFWPKASALEVRCYAAAGRTLTVTVISGHLISGERVWVQQQGPDAVELQASGTPIPGASTAEGITHQVTVPLDAPLDGRPVRSTWQGETLDVPPCGP